MNREVGVSLSLSEQQVAITLSPGAVREGETFVLVWSVEPLTADELADSEAGDDVRSVDGFASRVTADVVSGRVLPCRVTPAR